jgi:hypothetical protein
VSRAGGIPAVHGREDVKVMKYLIPSRQARRDGMVGR